MDFLNSIWQRTVATYSDYAWALLLVIEIERPTGNYIHLDVKDKLVGIILISTVSAIHLPLVIDASITFDVSFFFPIASLTPWAQVFLLDIPKERYW
ncbi:hypothetical protein NPIL_228711 [Nephila pilipes]|uniref:Uncharacterized protein n=1 Tax=Nephila pilipes TaxID=299642 RepID=A0A8X6TVE4_NEPPI|nr:hypothetical protein NPIL_228711 [Nephila pilipes]